MPSWRNCTAIPRGNDMPWRLIEVDKDDAIDSDLTNHELGSLSLLLALKSTPDDVFRSVWQKIQPQVSTALEND